MKLLDKIKIYDDENCITDFLYNYKGKHPIFLGFIKTNTNIEYISDLKNIFDNKPIEMIKSYAFVYGHDIIKDIFYKGKLENFSIEAIIRNETINDIIS